MKEPNNCKSIEETIQQSPSMVPYRHTEVTPEVAANLLKSKDAEIKDLKTYKRKVDHEKNRAADYRDGHSKMRISMINIRTGKETTLWNLTYDVLMYLKGLSKAQRGKLFERWREQHNFNEFVRYRMQKEGFSI